MKFKILIIGNYGKNNFGDDLLLYSITDFFIKKILTSSISIITYKKVSQINNKKINQIRVDKMLIFKKIFFHFYLMFKHDILVFGGGNIFNDSRAKNYLNQYFFLLLIIFSKILKKKVILFGVGLGPAKLRSTKTILKIISYLSDLIYLRDKISKKYLKKNLKNVFFGYDFAFNLFNQKKIKSKKIKQNVGISFSFDINQKEKKSFISSVQEYLSKHNKDKQIIKIFNLYNKSRYKNDIQFFKKKNLINNKNYKIKYINYNGNIVYIFNEFKSLKILFAERLHSAILSFYLNIPTVINENSFKLKYFSSNVKNKKVISDIIRKNSIIIKKISQVINQW